jgi:hypothetical protein
MVGILVAGPVPYRVVVASESAYPTPLAVRADDIRISEGVGALTRGDDVFLPVRELAMALEFSVGLDPDRAVARGWFLDRSRRYRIDAREGEVTRDGEVRSFESTDFLTDRLADQRELYVRPSVLEHAWPVELSVSRSGRELIVEPDALLPAQQRRVREQRQQDLLARQREQAPDLPVRKHRYGLFTPPVVGIDLEARSGPDGQTNRQRLRWSQEIAGVNVFGGLFASGSSGMSTEVRDARLTLRRFAGDEPMPGGLELVEVGDVSGEAVGRVGSLGAGRGVTLSSFPLARGDAFDRHSLKGEGPPGWDVELYRDRRLIDFQQVDGDGRYRFDGVELGSGANRFLIVLYGPQGQKRVRTETVDVGQTQARPGETHLRLDHIEAGRDFVSIGDDEEETADTEPGTAVRVLHGLNRSVSLEAAAIALPADDGEAQARYALLGVAGGLGPTATRLRILAQENGGVAMDLDSTLRIGSTTFRLGAGLFDEFTSPRVGFGDAALKGDFDLSVRGPVPLGDSRLWLGGRYGVAETVAGERRHQVDLSQRWNTGSVAWQNEVRYRVRDGGTGRWSANLGASDRWSVGGGDSVHWSASLGYAQDAGVTDGRLSTRYRFSGTTTAGLDLRHSAETGHTDAGIDVTREWDNARLSLTADGGDGTGPTVGVRYSVGFGPDGGHGYTLADARAPEKGALAIHAFVDSDGDGEFDADETPVPGARLKGALGKEGVTDEDGRMAMHDLEAHKSYPVQLNEDSLANPIWSPATNGRRVTVRPGSVPVVELPVTETRTVSGTFRLGPGGTGNVGDTDVTG